MVLLIMIVTTLTTGLKTKIILRLMKMMNGKYIRNLTVFNALFNLGIIKVISLGLSTTMIKTGALKIHLKVKKMEIHTTTMEKMIAIKQMQMRTIIVGGVVRIMTTMMMTTHFGTLESLALKLQLTN